MRSAMWGALFCAMAVAVLSACAQDGAPAGPQNSDASVAVGPAPLRRLTDREYLNALHDLFPQVSAPLPELPQDAVVGGFDNAASAQEPSDVRISRYETIANTYAEALTKDTAAVEALLGCDAWETEAAAMACADGFIERLGTLLFRRPITEEEHTRYMARFQDWRASVDFEAAAYLTVSALLQAPQFIYRIESTVDDSASVGAPLNPYVMASRLSFFLWESLPDETLLDAAAKDELQTEAQIAAQANRMLDDDRAKRVYWDFHRQWLGLDRIADEEHSVRTPEVDPLWTTDTQASAFTESKLFVENTFMASGHLTDLFTSPTAWIDMEMARVYGVSGPSTPGEWSEVTLPADERAGILTRAAFLAGYSHRGGTTPPIRGNGILLRVLCQLPKPPPADADLSMPSPDPEDGPQTNRMLFEARTKPAACMMCHTSLNGFGFGLENYNAAGEFRTEEATLPIDASGMATGTGLETDGPFDGPIDLSSRLGHSTVMHQCAAGLWTRFALGRAPVDAEQADVDNLIGTFQETDDVRALLVHIVTMPTFRLRGPEAN